MDDLLDYAHYVIGPSKLLIPLLVLAYFVIMYLRGRRIRQCHSCGAKKVRSTRPVGLRDTALGWFFIRPFRCEGCRERFYALRWSALYPRRKRVIWIVFEFRNRSLRRVVIRRIKLRPNLRPVKTTSGSIPVSPSLLRA